MVDRVYKSQIPALRKTLNGLRREFTRLDPDSSWPRLRIDPVLRHAELLEKLLNSEEFSQEFSRLKRGVVLFKSDLDYLRANVKGLRAILQNQRGTARKTPG
jgi:hypothetical protein